MFKFLLYETIHEAGMEVLNAAGTVRLASDTDEDSIIAEIGDIDGVVIRSRGAMTRRIMENAPRLKVVGRHGVGVDNVDLDAATEHGIQVVNTPMAVVQPVAEHTVAMMLSLSKHMYTSEVAMRDGDFEIRYRIMGRELRGRTVGIIGFGRIGRRVAEILHRGFDMQVLYTDVMAAPELERELGARKVELDELLRTAEYITVHVPLLPETRRLIGDAQFDMMRRDALFFNASRGPVVDEAALCRALTENKIAGAGLDVFEQEPTPADNPLLKMSNVLVTPHMATATHESMREMALVARDLVAVLEGRPPEYPVNRLNN
jgi:D-3-phosphoglycerate dehydrogenase